MRAPKMGICERPPAEVPAAMSRLPPERTYCGERIFQQRRHRIDVGENDESVVGGLTVGGLVDVDRFEDEGRLRGRRERGADVERRAVVAVIMDQQSLLRVGTLDGEAAEIVGRKAVGGIDFHFAAVEAVGHFERGELDGGAAVGGDGYGFGCGGFAVDDQRHGALRGGSAVACNHGLHVDGLDVLAPDLSGSVDRFDRPVGFGQPGEQAEASHHHDRRVGEALRGVIAALRRERNFEPRIVLHDLDRIPEGVLIRRQFPPFPGNKGIDYVGNSVDREDPCEHEMQSHPQRELEIQSEPLIEPGGENIEQSYAPQADAIRVPGPANHQAAEDHHGKDRKVDPVKPGGWPACVFLEELSRCIRDARTSPFYSGFRSSGRSPPAVGMGTACFKRRTAGLHAGRNPVLCSTENPRSAANRR